MKRQWKSILSILIIVFITITFFNAYYSVGQPSKIIAYNQGRAIEILEGDKKFNIFIREAEKMIKKQIYFNYIAACVAPEDVATYKDEPTLELIYNSPVKLRFINKKVYRIFIDFTEPVFFIAENENGKYRSGAYPLVENKNLVKNVNGLFE